MLNVLFKTTLVVGLLSTQVACASSSAGYYRVWQGFKKTEMTSEQFLKEIPAFMNATTDIYTGVLNNYLVAIPPKNKPSFIPDEFALVAIRAEEDYKQIRSTDAGKAYGEKHWEVFNKETSKSAPYEFYGLNKPAVLENNKAYDMMGEPIDWKAGHTTFFIGLRKNNFSSAQYLQWLSAHVDEVAKSLRPYGLKGYVVIANENYEVAYMNWTSPEARTAAFATAEGIKARNESSLYMDRLQYSDMQGFNKTTIAEDKFYNTAQ